MTVRRRFDTKGYMSAQAKEVLGPLNRYYAGLAIGRDPTPEECWRHWCASHAAEHFRAAQQQNFWVCESMPSSADA
jgi:hypothetical protein